MTILIRHLLSNSSPRFITWMAGLFLIHSLVHLCLPLRFPFSLSLRSECWWRNLSTDDKRRIHQLCDYAAGLIGLFPFSLPLGSSFLVFVVYLFSSSIIRLASIITSFSVFRVLLKCWPCSLLFVLNCWLIALFVVSGISFSLFPLCSFFLPASISPFSCFISLSFFVLPFFHFSPLCCLCASQLWHLSPFPLALPFPFRFVWSPSLASLSCLHPFISSRFHSISFLGSSSFPPPPPPSSCPVFYSLLSFILPSAVFLSMSSFSLFNLLCGSLGFRSHLFPALAPSSRNPIDAWHFCFVH